MGRGRSGVTNQSMRKPKVRKNKQKGRPNFEIFHSPPAKLEHPPMPILVSEELLAEMKKMSPQDVINLLLPSN